MIYEGNLTRANKTPCLGCWPHYNTRSKQSMISKNIAFEQNYIREELRGQERPGVLGHFYLKTLKGTLRFEDFKCTWGLDKTQGTPRDQRNKYKL